MSNAQLAINNETGHAAGVNEWLGDGQSAQIKMGSSFTTTHERPLDMHEHLFMIGDKQTHLYQILEGVIGVYKMLPDGRRQIVTFYYPGDMIGGGDKSNWTQHAEALCNAKVRCIPVSTVDTLITTEPGFGQALMSMLATELEETRDQLLSLGRKSALEKVATFLLRISRRNKREGADESLLHLPMKRAEIADYLGLTIETVSRNITKLKTTGIIRLESKSEISVKDISLLEELADGGN